MRALLTGLVLLLAVATAGQASDDMTFTLARPRNCGRSCPLLIIAQGRITQDSDKSFAAVARTVPRHTPVVLNSQGGELVGGVRLGLALRQHGSPVLVPRGAVCASACAYAFLGGVVRRASEGSRIGVHRFFAVNRSTGRRVMSFERSVGPEATALLTNYVRAMGARPELVGLAGRVDPSGMYFLDRNELRRYGVVTLERFPRSGHRLAVRKRDEPNRRFPAKWAPVRRLAPVVRAKTRPTENPRAFSDQVGSEMALGRRDGALRREVGRKGGRAPTR